jgi:hypothetical protein
MLSFEISNHTPLQGEPSGDVFPRVKTRLKPWAESSWGKNGVRHPSLFRNQNSEPFRAERRINYRGEALGDGVGEASVLSSSSDSFIASWSTRTSRPVSAISTSR